MSNSSAKEKTKNHKEIAKRRRGEKQHSQKSNFASNKRQSKVSHKKVQKEDQKKKPEYTPEEIEQFTKAIYDTKERKQIKNKRKFNKFKD